MNESDVQSLCARGQERLVAMDYLAAENLLERAEALAWKAHDWDALSRLYMPLQEARRQRRQRCGEGIVKLDIVARSPGDRIDPNQIVKKYPHGQLLVGAWNDPKPAIEVRKLARELGLYLDVFIASVEQRSGILVVKIHRDGTSPDTIDQPVDALPIGERIGNDETYAETMSVWEMLHAPFLANADAQSDPIKKMDGYRKAIEVDYACELAHQNLSLTARSLAQTSTR